MEIAAAVEAVVSAKSWDARVTLIRQIPESFGKAQHTAIYSEIAKTAYVPHLAPDFAYVHWRDEYELGDFQAIYDAAATLTDDFSDTTVVRLAAAITKAPKTLRVFRTMLGLTTQEFAASTDLVSDRLGAEPLGSGRVKSIEAGASVKPPTDTVCATVIDEAMRGSLFPPARAVSIRPKIEKPDTIKGWASIRGFAKSGVPLSVFLHQRHYGGAFRQLLDATSTTRGDVIEDAVGELLTDLRIPHLRTGSHNQSEIEAQFGLTVKPAPDFVMYDRKGTLRAMLECKGANDGGTARDKSNRFGTLRSESVRLGGVPLFAVLAGLGWRRTGDALGPVVRDTDGRVFTLATLMELRTVFPLTDLAGQVDK